MVENRENEDLAQDPEEGNEGLDLLHEQDAA